MLTDLERLTWYSVQGPDVVERHDKGRTWLVLEAAVPLRLLKALYDQLSGLDETSRAVR